MSESPELDRLLAARGQSFVEAAYLALLERPVDPDGMRHYMGRLERGDSALRVLGDIARSPEALRLGAHIPGLERALQRDGVRRLLARLWRRTAPGTSAHDSNHLAERLAACERRISQLEASIARASSATVQAALLQVAELSPMQAIARAIAPSVVADGETTERYARALADCGADEFISGVFRLALQRAPQAHERTHFAHLIERGDSRASIATLLLESPEGRQVRADSADAGTATAHKSGLGEAAPEPPPVALESIRFPAIEHPLVSIIVPVYGKVRYTLACLSSIREHMPGVPFEVIIVNDASPDDTASIVGGIPGVRLLENPRNLGFIGSCNHGAVEAHGEYICFLNNDTQVRPGWLDELVRTFSEFPGTGLAGSKLVYPNGVLQEAGGIIWRDGSAWNFGRNQDADLPIYNYAREVDYCSGASILIPKSLFFALGGFDAHYSPAYCEDADLALKVRDRGLRVIYQPMSVVVHYEGITSGTDTTQGVKAYQVENMKKMFERWRDRLATHQENAQDVDRAKDRMASRRVLVLDHCTPTPDQDAGSVITYNLLLLLRELGFQPTFVAEDNFLYMPQYTTALQRLGIEVLYHPYQNSVERHLQEAGARYDLVIMFRPGVVSRHIGSVRKHCSGAKVIYHTVDLHYVRMSREAALRDDDLLRTQAEGMKQLEHDAARAVDATIVVSTSELDLLRGELPGVRVELLSLIMDIRGTEVPFEERRDIVFVGGYQHAPNVDAALFFAREVMPLLRKRLPGVRFVAVGSKAPPEVLQLAGPDVEVPGFVEDLSGLLDRMRVNVAPLRFGAGIKGKIGGAMACGLPSVASTIAAEGMGLRDGEHLLSAESPAQYCESIARLYEDRALWNRLSRAGLDFAQSAWGPRAAIEQVRGILDALGLHTSPPSRELVVYIPGERLNPASVGARHG